MTIAEWLNSSKPLYSKALLLYKHHGGDPGLLRLFESGENAFTRTRIRAELTRLNSDKQSVPVSDGRPPQPEIKASKEPIPLKPIYDLKAISFKEMAALHAQLRGMKTDEERYTAAQRIFELDQLVDHCWYQIDYFNEHGRLPELEGEMAIKTIGDVVRLSKNIPTYISKLNARLRDDKLSENAREELLHKKAQYQVVLTKIEGLLNEPVSI